MHINQKQFDEARTIAQFVAQMGENQALFAENYELAAISEDDRAWFSRQTPLQVLALADDWCIDVITALPILAKLADMLGEDEFKLRVLIGEENEEIAAAYTRPSGRTATPVFIFFDAQMRERGHLIERPAAAYPALDNAEKEFAAAAGYPIEREQRSEEQMDEVGQYRREWRATHRRELARMLLDELRQVIADN